MAGLLREVMAASGGQYLVDIDKEDIGEMDISKMDFGGIVVYFVL